MPTDLTLRPAGPEDAETLAGLFLSARAAAYPAMPLPVHSEDEVRSWFAQLLDDGPRTIPMPAERETWVAESAEGVGGYLVLDRDWLDSLYIRPDLTGHGVGSALLGLAKVLRPDGFGLWVFETNDQARDFYLRHDLVVVRRTDGSDNEERAPDLEMVWFGSEPLPGLRRRIDEVDDQLAVLLARRAALTAAVQGLKQVSGHAGRDPDREGEIISRMSEVAGGLGPQRLSRIMDVVIAESIDAAEQAGPPGRS